MNLLLKTTILFAGASLLLASFSAKAQDWDGGGDNISYGDPLNWIGDALPTGQSVLIGAGQQVTLDTDAGSSGSHLYVIYDAGFTIADGGSLAKGGGFNVATHGGSVGINIVQTGGFLSSGYGSLGAGFARNSNTSADWTMTGGTYYNGGGFEVGGGGDGTGDDTSTWDISGTADATVNSTLTLYGTTGATDDAGIINLSGTGSLTANGLLTNTTAGQTDGKINFTGGTLTVGQMNYDDPDDAVFSVGASSTLNLGDSGTHLFTDGLTITSDGTLGTGNNSATQATIDNTGGSADFTLQNGATIDYSIRGTDNTSDTLTFLSNADADFGTAPTALNLVVDVVAGDVKQTAGPFAIFDFGGTAPTGWDSITWTITTAEGTRLSSPGSVIVGDGLNGLAIGEIGLSGFEAFSIPEPSTAMLFGLGAMVMLLRRRIK